MKKLMMPLFMISVLLLAGCGKKRTALGKNSEESTIVDSQNASKSEAPKQDIPVYEYDEEKYLDADSIADFAFVDDEDEAIGSSKHAKKTADLLEEEFDDAISWGDEEEEYAFKTVNFDLNGNEIRKDQLAAVKADIALAKDAVKDGKSIVISGHACQLGEATYNLALSEKRAKVLKDEMINSGIPAERIRIVGCGHEMPIAWSDKTDRNELVKELAPNRRAEITTL